MMWTGRGCCINLRTGSSHHRRHSHDFTRGTFKRGRSQIGGLDDEGNFEVDQVCTSVKLAGRTTQLWDELRLGNLFT